MNRAIEYLSSLSFGTLPLLLLLCRVGFSLFLLSLLFSPPLLLLPHLLVLLPHPLLPKFFNLFGCYGDAVGDVVVSYDASCRIPGCSIRPLLADGAVIVMSLLCQFEVGVTLGPRVLFLDRLVLVHRLRRYGKVGAYFFSKEMVQNEVLSYGNGKLSYWSARDRSVQFCRHF